MWNAHRSWGKLRQRVNVARLATQPRSGTPPRSRNRNDDGVQQAAGGGNIGNGSDFGNTLDRSIKLRAPPALATIRDMADTRRKLPPPPSRAISSSALSNSAHGNRNRGAQENERPSPPRPLPNGRRPPSAGDLPPTVGRQRQETASVAHVNVDHRTQLWEEQQVRTAGRGRGSATADNDML